MWETEPNRRQTQGVNAGPGLLEESFDRGRGFLMVGHQAWPFLERRRIRRADNVMQPPLWRPERPSPAWIASGLARSYTRALLPLLPMRHPCTVFFD
jgi:hypothetical protein